jgi:hypothetical protein
VVLARYKLAVSGQPIVGTSVLGYDDLSVVATGSLLLLRSLLERNRSEDWPLGSYGGVAQLVERLTGSQEVRGFESHRLHSKSQVRVFLVWGLSRRSRSGEDERGFPSRTRRAAHVTDGRRSATDAVRSSAGGCDSQQSAQLEYPAADHASLECTVETTS